MRSGNDDASVARFLGHSANADGTGVPELLRDHLRRVAAYAARFSSAFAADEQGKVMGLRLHHVLKSAQLNWPPRSQMMYLGTALTRSPSPASGRRELLPAVSDVEQIKPPPYGPIGKHGSIAVVERFILT